MEKWVIRAEGLANGDDTPFDGQFLKWFDPHADDYESVGGWTDKIDDAVAFSTPAEASVFWRSPLLSQDGIPRLRPDGKENRPLTAFTVSIMERELARRQQNENYTGARRLLDAIFGRGDGNEYN